MLQRFFQQVWFILLMVFTIGWGTMSVASANAMHLIQMQQQPCAEQMIHVDQHVTHMAAIEHGMHTLAAQHCDNPASSQQHECLDCSFSACQSMMSWFNTESQPLTTSQLYEANSKLSFPYTGRHLSGYWQDILRPPKA
ncbi:hypothetical protein Asch01_00251 [Acinetobacter schindleri]|uniref:hypothetical protein n=1 Tax=Acinetobacter schindleri TaxID=108981 RepID=UPI0030A53AA6